MNFLEQRPDAGCAAGSTGVLAYPLDFKVIGIHRAGGDACAPSKKSRFSVSTFS